MTLPTFPSSSSTSHHSHAFATRTIHVGSSPADSATGGVSTPLDLSTTYAQRGVGNLVSGFEYSRSSNPTRLALEKVLASLEGADVGLAKELERQGGEGQSVEQWTKENGPPALAFASGSAATATVLQALAGGNGTGHIVSVGTSLFPSFPPLFTCPSLFSLLFRFLFFFTTDPSSIAPNRRRLRRHVSLYAQGRRSASRR
jgi:cystathionine beta-lyase/cystathionine gamma-synthase